MKRKLYDISFIFFICLFVGISRSLILQDIDIVKLSSKVSDTLSEDLFSAPGFIDIALSEKLFSESALFIDARDSLSFILGHISGAINIPWDSYSDDEISNSLKDIPYDRVIITYCSGGDCTLSMDLADYIFNDLGFEKVLIFEGGYPIWINNKLPVNRICSKDESITDETCIYVE